MSSEGEGCFNHKKELLTEDDGGFDLSTMKAGIDALEEEARKLCHIQAEVDKEIECGLKNSGLRLQKPVSEKHIGHNLPQEEKTEIDARSVYVKHVDYGVTAKALGNHFRYVGEVNRVTILRNKWNGTPKGFAYIEFKYKQAVQSAIAMDGTELRGRVIAVMPKRTNIPGISSTSRPPRGLGGKRRGSRFLGRRRFHGKTRPTRSRGFSLYYAPY